MDEKPLYVPAHFRIRAEIWSGIGTKEIAVIAMVGIIIAIVAFCAYFIFEVDAALCFASSMFGIALATLFVQKSESGLSVLDFLIIKRKYRREQQKYKFVYSEAINDVQ